MSTTEVETTPTCAAPSCGASLVLRDGWKPGATGNGWTMEQRACGAWYDHPPHPGGLTGHTSAALIPVTGGSADHAPRLDPAPWRHVSGQRVADPGAADSPRGGFTYAPREGYSDHPGRYVSTRRRAAL